MYIYKIILDLFNDTKLIIKNNILNIFKNEILIISHKIDNDIDF